MKENKLSREELIVCFRCLSRNLKTIHKRPDVCNQYKRRIDVPWAICADAFHAIKSLLTPIPEDVLNEFVKRYADDIEINMPRSFRNDWIQKQLKQMLKEYDEKKENA